MSSRASSITDVLSPAREHESSSDDNIDSEVDYQAAISSPVVPRRSEGTNYYVHNQGLHEVYLYLEGRAITEADRTDFLELAREYCSHIHFGRNNRKKSKDWKFYYKALDSTPPHTARVCCIRCGQILKHPLASQGGRGSLSGLKHHSERCNWALGAVNSSALDDTSSGSAVYTRHQMEEAQLALSVACNIPFTTFEKRQFHDFCTVLRKAPSNNDLMSRKVLANRLHKNAHEARVTLKKDLEANKSRISISLDGWTAPNNILFLGIIAHFIDNTFRVRREILAFDILLGVHTGEALCNSVWDKLKAFGLTDKVR